MSADKVENDDTNNSWNEINSSAVPEESSSPVFRQDASAPEEPSSPISRQDAPAPDEPSSPVSRQDAQHHSRGTYYTYILIMGPSGSGKSTVINMVSDDKVQVASQGTGLCTTGFRFSQQVIAGQTFRLIDSPGLNTKFRSNFEIFKRSIIYLIKMHVRLAGILYLYPEGTDFNRDELRQNLETIKRLFGDPWLSNLTIATVENGSSPNSDAPHEAEDPTSPLYYFQTAGAKVRRLDFQPEKIHRILLEFNPSPPTTPKFLFKVKHRHTNRIDFDTLENLVGEATRGARAHPSNQSGRRLPKHTREEAEDSRQQLQLALTAAEDELKVLRSQLEQTRLEYGSLRSELQLHDNTEQNKVVQSLKDLNRSIEDFSRVVAQYLVDNYIEPKDIDSVTTLQAFSLPDLKIQFEHQDGSFSLIASSSGAGMPTEDFIDLALRSILCRRLYEGIFLPFHPMLTTAPEITFMANLYDGVRRHALQNVAAKWRASSFVALSEEKGPEARKGIIEAQVERIMKDDISKLIENFFGREKGVLLTEQHHHRLKEIVVSAWEWNDVLKGDVVTLGDFQPTFYGPGTPFDARSMLEFEPDKNRESPPETVICTVGLGLSLFHSKAQGDAPGPTAVCKATVATEHFYTRS